MDQNAKLQRLEWVAIALIVGSMIVPLVPYALAG